MEFGLSAFRKHFADYPDQYVIIGGAACDLLLSSAGLVFRLFPIIDEDSDVITPVEIYKDIQKFINQMDSIDVDLKGIGVTRDKTAILEVYRKIYKPEY